MFKTNSHKELSALRGLVQRSVSSSGMTTAKEQSKAGRRNIVSSSLCMMKAFADLHCHAEDEGDETPPSTPLSQQWQDFRTKVKENSKYYSVSNVQDAKKFYNYALIVSIQLNEQTGNREPYIKMKFPEQAEVPEAVKLFCYPDFDGKSPDNSKDSNRNNSLDCSENYSFVITDDMGNRHYGYCKRLPCEESFVSSNSLEVICIVGPRNASKLYQKVLVEFERMRQTNSDSAVHFLENLHAKPLPSPGKTLLLSDQTSSDNKIQVVTLSRAEDTLRDAVNYHSLVQQLTTKNIIKVFSAILLERKIVFLSDQLSILSATVHTFTSLLYPLAWQHTLIPVLPSSLLEVVCSPTPFLVGVHLENAAGLEQLELDEVMIVNLDSNELLISQGDESRILPKKLSKILTNSMSTAKNDIKASREVKPEGFLDLFVEVFGKYKQFIGYDQHGEPCFQFDKFIESHGTLEMQEFLKWFTETQMFQIYMNEKLSADGTDDDDVFDEKTSSPLKDAREYQQVSRGRRHTAFV